ncbi:MAG: hypothetical protein LBK60_12305 [Verrucomicrobiales bacterium]|jgi:hypothetical protein|nr:hypothetical protein [Verrucomicrobiales bacterium]
MWKLIRNLIIAATLIGIGCCLLNLYHLPPEVTDAEETLKNLLVKMAGGLFIAGGAAVLLWPVAGVVGSYFESLFWAKGGNVDAPPMYKLAAWLVEQGRYGESLAEYQKITKHDKRATLAYEGQLFVMVQAMGMGGTPAVQKLLAAARKNVTPEELPHLDWFYEQLLAGNPEVCARPPHVEEIIE